MEISQYACSGLSSNPGQQDNSGFPVLKSKSRRQPDEVCLEAIRVWWISWISWIPWIGSFPEPSLLSCASNYKLRQDLQDIYFMLWVRLGGFFIIKLGMSPCEPLHFQDTSSFQPLQFQYWTTSSPISCAYLFFQTFSAEAHNLLVPQAPGRVVIGANGSKQWGNACDVTRLVSLFWQRTTPLNQRHELHELGCWPTCIGNELNKLQCAAWCICWATSAFSQPLSEVFIQVPLKALTRQEEQRKPSTHRSMGMEGGRIVTTCHLGMKMSWWDGTGK